MGTAAIEFIGFRIGVILLLRWRTCVCACVCVCVSSIRCLFVRKSEMKVNMTKWERKVFPFAASIVCASKSPGSAFRRGLFLDVSGLEVCALGNLGRFLSCVCTLLVTSHNF